MKVKDSNFLKSYRNQSCDVILRMHPEWTKEQIKPFIDSMLEEELMNPPARIENNYTHEEKDTTLLSVFDWCLERKPIIAGNATFFKQHAVSLNPCALMLTEFLTSRKREKKLMFAVEDERSRLYKMHDLKQGNWKKLANSYYGGSGMKSSAFYNKFTAPSTTKSAQSVISTAMTTFEAFLVSSSTFVDINECYRWIETVLNEEDNKLDDWVVRVSLEDTYNRLSDMVIIVDDNDRDMLREYLSALSQDELTRLYYKNNLIEFTDRHPAIKELHDIIFASVRNFDYMDDDNDFDKVPDEYLNEVKSAKKPAKKWADIVDTEYFYDPNNVPKTIKEPIEILTVYYMKYCYVKFLYTDRIYKLKNFQRNVVTVIDTDSNILSLDTWMEYALNNLLRSDYGRDRWNNIFIAINTIAYVITAVITKTLLFYGECSNVDEEHRPGYSMKNEFFFANLVLAKVKKRYCSKIILREGHRLLKPKYDVKGFDFKKAGTSETASNFFMHVVEDMILEPERVDINAIMDELSDFRNSIKESLEKGDRSYLPTGNFKEIEAYAEPWKEQSVRAGLAWNAIMTENQLEAPVKISILKTTIESLDDCKELQNTHPDIYENIKNNIFGDTTGIFVRSKSTGEEDIKGLTVLGIPINKEIPEWVRPYIDYTSVMNAVLAPFKSVPELFSMPSIEEGKTGRKSTGFSNIVLI